MEEYYTYLWLREDGTPYYVGKGKGIRGVKGYNHRFHAPQDTSRIIFQYWPSEKDAFAAEIFLIEFYGREDLKTGCLLNMTAGGEGVRCYTKNVWIGRKHSEISRQKQRQAKLGRKLSSEHRKKISEAGRKRKGEKRSNEVREKMREVTKRLWEKGIYKNRARRKIV